MYYFRVRPRSGRPPDIAECGANECVRGTAILSNVPFQIAISPPRGDAGEFGARGGVSRWTEQPCGPLARAREREHVALPLPWSDNSGSVNGAVGACLPVDSTHFQRGKWVGIIGTRVPGGASWPPWVSSHAAHHLCPRMRHDRHRQWKWL